MQYQPLDPATAERLLTGALAPEDAPEGYAEVAALLSEARIPAATSPLPNEQETVAAMAAAVGDSLPVPPNPSRRPRMLTRAKLAAAGLAGALTLTTGLAAANALPGAAQNVASDMLDKVGVSVPGPNAHAGDHPDVRGQSGEHEAVENESSTTTTVSDPDDNDAPEVEAPETEGDDDGAVHPDNKGGETSQLAQDTPAGPDHGPIVSGAASDGKSQAGEHGGDTSGSDNGQSGEHGPNSEHGASGH